MNHLYGLDAEGAGVVQRVAEMLGPLSEVAVEVDRDGRFPEESVTALSKQGYLALFLPTDVGGGGQTPAVFAGVVEQIAQTCPSTAMIYVMHVSAAQAIVASTTLADRESVLAEIVAGKHLSTLAFSERGSRSQFWAPVSSLVAEGDGSYRTSASKSWVTSANRASSMVSSAQKSDADSPLELTLYLASRDSAGIEVAGEFRGLGLRGNDSAPMQIENLHVAEGDLLTDNGAGMDTMLQVILPWFAVGTSAMAHGLCLAATAATRRHLSAAPLEHTGTLLRDLPNLRARLAEMNCRTEQSRALLGFTVQQMLTPTEETPLFVLQSRLAALQAAVDVTDLAMKACGGAAFSKHLGVERMFRDARAGWVMAPTVDHLQEFVGRALTGLPLF